MGGAQPAGDSAAALREQATAEQHGQAPGVAAVQAGREGTGAGLPKQGQVAKIHGGTPGWGRGRVSSPILARGPSSGHHLPLGFVMANS
jgi:hypothetical protein